MTEDLTRTAVMTSPSATRLSVVGRDAREQRVEELVEELLSLLGEDPGRPGLVKTPARVRKALAFLTEGYRIRPSDVVGDALFAEGTRGEVIVRGIEFHSLCEHHMLPFHGVVHIGYLPGDCVVGLSKLPRLVDVFARRLQVQERLTEQVADAIESVIAPRGVAVAVDAVHMCMTMRGVEKQHPSTLSSTFRGRYADDPDLRAEFLNRTSA